MTPLKSETFVALGKGTEDVLDLAKAIDEALNGSFTVITLRSNKKVHCLPESIQVEICTPPHAVMSWFFRKVALVVVNCSNNLRSFSLNFSNIMLITTKDGSLILDPCITVTNCTRTFLAHRRVIVLSITLPELQAEDFLIKGAHYEAYSFTSKTFKFLRPIAYDGIVKIKMNNETFSQQVKKGDLLIIQVIRVKLFLSKLGQVGG